MTGVSIDVSKYESCAAYEMALLADKDGNGKLTGREITVFKKSLEKAAKEDDHIATDLYWLNKQQEEIRKAKEDAKWEKINARVKKIEAFGDKCSEKSNTICGAIIGCSIAHLGMFAYSGPARLAPVTSKGKLIAGLAIGLATIAGGIFGAKLDKQWEASETEQYGSGLIPYTNYEW